MPLDLDQLREVGAALPPSHIPGPAEAFPILGALVAAAEHGVDELLEAAKADQAALEAGEPATAVNKLLAPPSEDEPAPVTPTPPTPPASPDVDLAAENAALRQQLETARANQQRTEPSVEPVPKQSEGLS